MNLTDEQRAALKAFVEADPVLSTYPHTSSGAFEVGEKLSQLCLPCLCRMES